MDLNKNYNIPLNTAMYIFLSNNLYPAEGSPAAVGPVTPVRADKSRVRRTNRGVGISAEPQSLKTLQELTTKTFPEIKKEER